MDEDIRNPDNSYHDKLINDNDNDNDNDIEYRINNIQDNININEINQLIQSNEDTDLEKALLESRKIYEKQIEKEQIKIYRQTIFKKLNIQLGYLLLNKDNNINFFVECFNNEKEKYIHLEKDDISLFKHHYDYLLTFLEDIYTKHIEKNKNPKIDKELYDLLNNILNYN